MNFHLDSFSILHGVLVAEGYSECGAPGVLYDGKRVATTTMLVERPELVAGLGEPSRHWGFRLCAMMPDRLVVHSNITIQFADGTCLDFPGGSTQAACDPEYNQMVQRFKNETSRGGRLLEIGSRARSGNTYRDWFSDKIEYTGLDVTEGPNVDVVGDAHHLSRYVTGKFDFVFSISVFEHILMPWMVAIEMARVMNTGGICFIQSHSSFPLHDQPWDFWRYSKDAWRGIFNVHTGFEVLASEYAVKTWTVPTYACSGAAQDMDQHPNWLISGSLVRKIGEPRVAWDANAAEVYDLAYNHA